MWRLLCCIALALAVALACIRASAAVRHETFAPPPDVEIVISHYDEDIEPLKALLRDRVPHAKIVVYSKGPVTDPDSVARLPNVGREAHTFLTHVIRRYDDLAAVTVFVMGSALYSEHKRAMLDRVMDRLVDVGARGFVCGLEGQTGEPADFCIDAHRGNTDSEVKPLSLASPRPFKAWYDEHVRRPFPPPTWCPAALMAASRDRIRKRSLESYQQLVRQVEGATDTEAGHDMERAWPAIFS